MFSKIPEGALKPCPVCGGSNITWNNHNGISLLCNDCKFEMYPSEDFSSEEAYFEEWNNLSDIDNIINSHDEKIKVAQQIIAKSTKERNYYIWTKKRMQAAKEEFSQVQ